MAKSGKRLTYDVSFVTNLDAISKQLKTDLSNIKIDFPSSNVKASGYLKTLESTIKNFETQYRSLMKNISQPGVSSKQIVSLIEGFKTTVDTTRASLQSFKSSLSNTFNAQDLKPLKDLETQLKRVQKASENISGLKQKRAGLMTEASGVAGRSVNYSRMSSTIDRYSRLQNVESTGGTMRINDKLWMTEVADSISQLVEIKKQVDGVQAQINKEIAKAGELTQGTITRGTKEEFNSATSGILNEIKSLNSQIISDETYKNIDKNSKGLGDTLKVLGMEYDQVGEKAKLSLTAQEQMYQDTEKVAQSLKSVLGELGVVFSAAWVVNQLQTLARQSFDFYKSLDNALTEISIVSDLSRKQVQGLTDDFIRLSKQTGMAIDDIAKASVIFFQQGLNTKDVLTMTEVTAQFAKVASTTVEDAADKLTAAVNGFQIGVDRASEVADKLNAVAAKSAASINELSTAFEKAASMASQAGIGMDSYLAYIATMVEVTREAPENIGTSLKTIIARFQQVKDAGSTEDMETDVNQVEKALRSVGIALRDDNNQLRDLEEVLAELGPMWNTLDRNTQAYLGTIIAGTRQQSRLIALMQNWDRALELAAVSERSAGMQALMHEKAMQGLDAAINMTTNAWQKFLAQLTNSDLLISMVNLLTNLINTLSNKDVQRSLFTIGLLIGLQQLQKILPTLRNAFTKMFDDFTKSGKAAGEQVKALNEQIDKLSKTKGVGEVRGVRTTQGERATLSTTLGKKIGAKDKLNNEELLALQEQRLDLMKKSGNATDAQTLKLTAQIGRTQNLVNIEKQLTMARQAAAEQAKIAASASISSAITIVGLLTGIVALFGGLDTQFGQIAIGAISFGAAVFAGVKAFNALKVAGVTSINAIKMAAGPILQIITLAIGGIIAIVDALTVSSKEALENLQKQTEETNNLVDTIDKQRTVLRVTKQSIKDYEELSSKIIKTTDEQQRLNEAASALATQYDNVTMSYDKYGNAVINMVALQDEILKKNNEIQVSQEKLIASIVESSKLMANQTGGRNVEEQEKYVSTKKEASYWTYVGDFWGAVFGPDTVQQAMDDWDNAKAALSEMDEEAAGLTTNEKWLKGLEENKEAIIKAYGDLTDSSTQAYEDAEGKIVASAATKTFLQENLQGNIVDALKTQLEGMQLSDDVVDSMLKEYMTKWQASWNNNADAYNEWSRGIEKVSDDIQNMGNDLSFGDAQDKIEQFTREAAGAAGIVNESQIQAMVDSAIDVSFNSLGFAMSDLLDKFKNDPRMTEMIKGMSAPMLDIFQNLDLFSGEGGNEALLQAMSGSMDIIRQAYSRSGEEGAATLYKALAEAMNAPGATEEVKVAAETAMQGVMDSLEVATDKTWGQIADFLTDSTESLRTMNDLVAQLAEKGGWTLEEFGQFAKVLDSINLDNLDADQLDSFVNAIGNMNIGIDQSSGLITAQGDAVKYVREIQEQAFKAEIEEMKNNLQAKVIGLETEMALVEAEKKTNEQLMEWIVAQNQTELKLSDVKNQANELYQKNNQTVAKNLKTTYQEMSSDSVSWARISLTGIAKVGQAMSALAKGNYEFFDKNSAESLINQVQTMVSSVTWQGGTNALDALGTDDSLVKSANILTSLEAYNKSLTATIDNYKNTITAVQSKIAALANIASANLSKIGGSGDQKQIEEYIGKLTEMLNVLRQIEKIDHKLEILGSFQDIAIGKQYTEILLEQLDSVRKQKVAYKQLYDLQKDEVNRLAQSILSGKYRKVFSFLEDGSIQTNMSRYNTLSQDNKKIVDELYESYQSAFEEMVDYHETAMQYWQEEIDIMQERVDSYIDAEDEMLDAVKKREQDILDVKLEAVDKEIEAINKAADARKKAREDEDSAKEISKLQTDLQRALMDTSAGSATRILEIQEQIKEKQKEMADGSFDRMVDDEIQAREDQKELEQESFDKRLEDMDYYWEEVEKIMSQGTESIIATLKEYSEEYLTASDAEQTEIVNGWSDTFNRISDLGKAKVAELQSSILSLKQSLDTSDWDEILSDTTINTKPAKKESTKTAAPALKIGSYVKTKAGVRWYADSYGRGSSGKARAGKIKYINTKGSHAYNIEGLGWVRKTDIVGYNAGGLNTSTGLAMLHGTASQPEAVLNALQTKTFIKFTNALDNFAFQGSMADNAMGTSVNIESIKFSVDSMSSEEDGKKAFCAFVDRFNEIGKQRGLSVRLPN